MSTRNFIALVVVSIAVAFGYVTCLFKGGAAEGRDKNPLPAEVKPPVMAPAEPEPH